MQLEFDVVDIITRVGFPITICLILSYILWKLIPVINGLKTVITELKGIVIEDSNNTRTMGTNISSLTTEIARLNKNGGIKK